MIKDEEIIELLIKAQKKIALKQIGICLLLTEKNIKAFINKEIPMPTHMKYVLKKSIVELLNKDSKVKSRKS